MSARGLCWHYADKTALTHSQPRLSGSLVGLPDLPTNLAPALV